MNVLARVFLAVAALGSAVVQAETLPETSSWPTWQTHMTHHRIAGHPYWPNEIQPDGATDLKIWPAKDYWVYVPPLAQARQNPSLVIYLHGSNQTAEHGAQGSRWNELADRRGFVVVYPQGEGNNWGWGKSTVFGRGSGELEAVARITAAVHRDFGTNPRRTYVAGISSGAITATMLGAMYADFYTAVMSVLGCSYNCADPTGHVAYQAMLDNAVVKVVPALNIHGTLDNIFSPPLAAETDSQSAGTNDLADNGAADGSIAQVPEIDTTHMAVPPPQPGQSDECITAEGSTCAGVTLGWETYPYEVHRYRDAAGQGRTIVEAWWIHGLAHRYPYGDTRANYTDPVGPDITTAGFEFFERINTAPDARDDAAMTPKNTRVTVAVVANDADADNDTLGVTAAGPAAHGTVTVQGDAITYAPRLGFSGTDAFSYTVSDGHGGGDTATVTVCVARRGQGC